MNERIMCVQDVVEKSKPGVIMIELYPNNMDELGYSGGALSLLEGIYNSGYQHVSHSG